MRSFTSARPNGRTVSAILVAGALVVSAGVGGATAGALIIGKDIQDKSITGADIADRSLGKRQLSTTAVDSLRTSWNPGVGAPAAKDGSTNSWYLDTATGDAYKNTSRGWELRVIIMGRHRCPRRRRPAGRVRREGGHRRQGRPWRHRPDRRSRCHGREGVTPALRAASGGAATALRPPAPAPSATGTTASWDAYEKIANGWAPVVNLRGAIGPKDDQGDQGRPGRGGCDRRHGFGRRHGCRRSRRHGRSVTLGTIVSVGAPVGSDTVAAQSRGVLIKTSTGFLLSVGWDGLAAKGQLYYSGSCGTGEAYWNAGSSAPQAMYDKSAVYSHSLNQWLVIASAGDGFATSAAMPTIGAFDNSGQNGFNCSVPVNQPTQSAWRMRGSTTTELGLPSMTGNQFALPLSIG